MLSPWRGVAYFALQSVVRCSSCPLGSDATLTGVVYTPSSTDGYTPLGNNWYPLRIAIASPELVGVRRHYAVQ